MSRWIASGAVLIASAILLGFAVMAGWLLWFDVPVMRAVALTDASPTWLVTTAQFVTSLGDPDPRSGFVVLICILFIARHCWRSAAIYFVTAAISIAGHTLAKIAYARPRPQLSPWFDHASDLSYPSGHAGGAMVILFGAALLVRERWLRWPALGLALAIAATRPMLGVHWPSDVIGGVMWGAGFALAGVGMALKLGLPRVRVLGKDAETSA